MTTIALFGDVHGNHVATAAVLADIDTRAPDHLVCLGDLVGYGAFPNETIDLVRQRDIPVIMGNYDDGIGFERGDCGCAYKDADEKANGERSVAWTTKAVTAGNKAWLCGLLPDYRLMVHGVRIRVVHGSPRRINEYLFEDRDPASLARIAANADCDVLVFGHTHVPWARTVNDVLFVNAGSAGKPKDGDPRACWAMLHITGTGDVTVAYHRVEYDIATAALAIRQQPGLPDIYATALETGGSTR
jgi:putative phosphoesterase